MKFSNVFKDLQKRLYEEKCRKEAQIHTALESVSFEDIEELLFEGDLGENKQMYYSYEFNNDQKLGVITHLNKYVNEINDILVKSSTVLSSMEMKLYSLVESEKGDEVLSDKKHKNDLESILDNTARMVVKFCELRDDLLNGPCKHIQSINTVREFTRVANSFMNVLDAAEYQQETLRICNLNLNKYMDGIEIKTQIPNGVDVYELMLSALDISEIRSRAMTV